MDATPVLARTDPSLSDILNTHDPESPRQVDLRQLVVVIESILQNVATDADSRVTSIDNMIDNLKNFEGMPQALDDIRSVTCEMSCNPLGSTEATMVVLRKLKNYSWNAKVVLAIAAFASSIGELSMLVHHRATDPIAKSVDLLKGQSLKLDFTVLKQLLKDMLEVVKANFEFSVPPISKIPQDAPPMKEAMDYFPWATYRILFNLVEIATILSKREENIDLTIGHMAKEVSEINVDFQQKLDVCKILVGVRNGPGKRPVPQQYIEVPQREEVVWEFMPKISIEDLIDQIKHKMKIQVPEPFRKKHVLFLISDLDISDYEIKVLVQLYVKNKQKYEIVWLPIVDPAYNKKRFSELKSLMQWGHVISPSKIGKPMVEYIRKEWHFIKNPIAVSVNEEGIVTCKNALPMLWTWGNLTFPFTFERERALWSNIDETTGWRLSLVLVEQIVPDISSWSGKFVCLLGGEKLEWIQEFTQSVKSTASAARVPLKLVYVGKSKEKGKGLSRDDLTALDIQVIESEFQWLFWTRLESMLFAQMQQGSKTSCVMQEALKMLGYASSGEGGTWAIFSMESAPMVTTSGEMAMKVMSNYKEWNTNKTYTGPPFLEALRDYYMTKMQETHDHGCIHVQLPVLGPIPGKAICPVCLKEMEMYYTYRCCV